MAAVSAIDYQREALGPHPNWLPAGKAAAVCFSIDDIHPSNSRDGYEAGGDLAAGALGRLAKLQLRHTKLKATLCVTPDWQLKSLVPDAGLLRRVPWASRYLHWTSLQPAGRFRLDRYPEFAAYLNGLERCQIVPHGLTHSHTGPNYAVEFQSQSPQECRDIVRRSLEIFREANLPIVRGYVPPAWNAPPALLTALQQLDFLFISSARDLETPVVADAITAGSGLNGVSLLYPQFVGNQRLVHLSCNFQATSAFERALQILHLGGVLHIKAHIFKTDGHHTMLDGLDDLYCNYLDLLFTHLTRRFGNRLWWAHLSEVAQRLRDAP